MTDEAGGGPGGGDTLVGTWAKVTRDEWAEKYPEQLRFTERGIYFGQSEETASSRYHTIWDMGRFEVVGAESVSISTSNDARITYTFNAEQDTLTFHDPDSGRQFTYRRQRGGAAEF